MDISTMKYTRQMNKYNDTIFTAPGENIFFALNSKDLILSLSLELSYSKGGYRRYDIEQTIIKLTTQFINSSGN